MALEQADWVTSYEAALKIFEGVESHVTTGLNPTQLLHFQVSSLLIHVGKQQSVAQVLGSPTPAWET